MRGSGEGEERGGAGGGLHSNYVLRDVDHHITVARFKDERAGGWEAGGREP